MQSGPAARVPSMRRLKRGRGTCFGRDARAVGSKDAVQEELRGKTRIDVDSKGSRRSELTSSSERKPDLYQIGGLGLVLAVSYVAHGWERFEEKPRNRQTRYIVKSDSGECHYYGFWECSRRGGDCEQLLRDINACVAAKWDEAKKLVGQPSQAPHGDGTKLEEDGH